MGAAAEDEDDQLNHVWAVAEHIFTAIFLFEMLAKLLADKVDYFMDGWNILDFIIVICSVIDTWILPSIVQNVSGDSVILGALRIFRLLRLCRVLKLLHAFPELMLVLEGIVSSLRSLLWVGLLLFVVIYAFSILVVQMVGQPDQGFQAYNRSEAALHRDSTVHLFNSYMYFGTLSRAMISLFGVVFMAEWKVVRPVWEVHPWMMLVLMLLVMFTTLGVLNIIVGVGWILFFYKILYS